MLQLTVQPRVSGVRPEHSAALRAAEELRDELRGVRGCRIEERQTPTNRAKGAVSDLVLALGGPAVIAGVVAIFRLWLQRDRRDRSLILRSGSDGDDSFVEIHGANVSDQTIRQAMDRMLRDRDIG